MDEILKEKILSSIADEIEPMEDGFYYWFPSMDRTGAMDSAYLRVVADHLDELNKDWKRRMDLDPDINSPEDIAFNRFLYAVMDAAHARGFDDYRFDDIYPYLAKDEIVEDVQDGMPMSIILLWAMVWDQTVQSNDFWVSVYSELEHNERVNDIR